MGKNSTIQLSVYVKLSVTVALEQSVKNSIDSNMVKDKLEETTYNYATLVKAHEPTIPGGRGFIWHYLEYKYDINVDLYNLIKMFANSFAAQVSKLFRNKRKRMIMEKIRQGIEDGFKNNINSNLFNHTAVKLIDVRIEETSNASEDSDD